MDRNSILKAVKGIKFAARKHQPEILTGLGIAGMITTTVMAVKATPKALDLMAEIKAKHEEDTDRKAFAKDVLVKVAPVYIPAILIGLTSTSCLIGANAVHLRRNAALATAFHLSESALKEYQEKVVETIGEKKEEAVRSAIAKDKIEKDPIGDREVIVVGNGETLCYDTLSGRYFKSDKDRLIRAENELNRQMRNDDYVSLNEFYDAIGLSFTKIGEDLGWHIDKGFIELDFSAQLTPEGTPCLVLDYQVAPFYGYDRYL